MENKQLKVLSVRNPYAYFIVKGIKDVENRTWQTKHRGKLLIHACGDSFFDYDYTCLPKEIIDDMDRYRQEKNTYNLSFPNKDKIGYPQFKVKGAKETHKLEEKALNYARMQHNKYYKSGLIIGQVTIVDCIKDSDSIWAHEDKWQWILTDAVMFDVGIKARGKLGLWNWEKDLVSC